MLHTPPGVLTINKLETWNFFSQNKDVIIIV